jgi:pimeloyl-ACP methyl ester carboxylesterase
MVEAIAHGDEDTRSAVFDIVAGLILGDEGLTAEWKAKWMAAPPERIIHPGGCLLNRDDITDRVPEISQPALIVHGTEDAAIPLDKAQLLRDNLADCRGLVEVPGAAHAPNLTHPDIVNPAIAAFLADL